MSEASIRQYEPIVVETVRSCVDQMAAEAKRRGCIDVFKWWCFLATDTIGELSFGESFRMIEKGEVCRGGELGYGYTGHAFVDTPP